LSLLSAVIFNLFFLATVNAQEFNVEAIQDPSLSQCIKHTLNKEGLSDVAQLTKLTCHNKGIQSLVGVELFTNLEHLSLFGNNITNAELSKLTHLTYLNLANNNLVSLNIAGLAELKTLYLFKNKLSTINFEGLIALEKVRLMENQLSQLDISPLTSVIEMYLWDNQLVNLDITGLTTLVFLDVKQNPMPDQLYDFFDRQAGITIIHDGNAEDWK
jgi:Leucine-rich repeat (LRR) protein